MAQNNEDLNHLVVVFIVYLCILNIEIFIMPPKKLKWHIIQINQWIYF